MEMYRPSEVCSEGIGWKYIGLARSVQRVLGGNV